MKLIIAAAVVVAAILQAAAQTETKTDADDEIALTSPKVIGGIGCSMGCSYTPENVIQMTVCSSGAQLDKKVQLQFDCARHDRKDECKSAKTSDGGSCIWVDAPPEAVARIGPGACLPSKLKKFQDQFFLGIELFHTVFKNVAVPNFRNFNFCLEKSVQGKEACTDAVDHNGQPCGWCEDLSAEYYPVEPPSTSMCVQNSLLPQMCDMLKPKVPLKLCEKSAVADPSDDEEEEEGIGERRSRRRARPNNDDPDSLTPNRPTDEATSSELSAAVISCLMSLYALLMLHA